MSERRPDIELSISPPPEALYQQRQRLLDDQAWNALVQAGTAQAETQTKPDTINQNVSAIAAVQMAPEPVPAKDLPPAPPDTPDSVINLVEAARASQTDPMMLEAIVKAAGAGFPATAAGVAPDAKKPPAWLDWLGNVANVLSSAAAIRGGFGSPLDPFKRGTGMMPAAKTQTPREMQAARNVAGEALAPTGSTARLRGATQMGPTVLAEFDAEGAPAVEALKQAFPGASVEAVTSVVTPSRKKFRITFFDGEGAVDEAAARAAVDRMGGGMFPEPITRPQGAVGAGARQQALPAGEVAPGAPGAAPRVNMERVGAEGTARDLIARIDTEMQATGDLATRTVGRQSHADTIAKAAGPGMSAADLLAIPKDQALNAAQQTRLRDLRDRAAQMVDAIAGAARKGDQAAADDLPGAMTLFAELHARDIAAGEVVGQALEARKITSEASRARVAELAALADRYRAAAEADGFNLAARIGDLPTAEARRSFIVNTVAAVWRGARMGGSLFMEYWVNALLSNPISHAANSVSGALQVLWMPAERFIAAAASATDAATFGGARSVFFSEAAAAYRGIWTGLRRGLELAGKKVRGEPVFGSDKAVEFPTAWTSEKFGLPADSLAGSALDYLGMVIRAPGAAMSTEDAFFKGVIFQMELEAQIAREIARRGLRGTEAVDLARAYRRTPPAEVEIAAQQMALVKTFNAELGPTGQAFLGLVDKIPAARLVFPFIRTPANILKSAAEYTATGASLTMLLEGNLAGAAALQLLNARLFQEIAAGGERRAFAIAKMAASAGIAAAFVELSGAGIISGPGPKDKNLRRDWQAQGFQPYHIYPEGAQPGAEGFAYARGTEPFGTSLAILATYAEIAGQIPEGDRLALAMAMTLAVSEHMADKPYLQGMSQLLAALHQPDKGIKAWIESFTRSLVPGALRNVTRSGIPGLMQGDRMRRDPIALTEMERLLNIIKQSVPGFSDDMPPVLHPITGEPVMFPPGWGPDNLSPIAASKLKDDPVLREIVENRISLPAPGDYIRGAPEPFVAMTEETGRSGVLMTPQEKHDLYVLMTKDVQDGQGRTLHQALTDLVQSERYQRDTRGPGGGRELRIKQVFLSFRKNAEQELLRRNDLLREAVETVTKQRLDLRRPSDTPQPSAPTLPIMPGRVDRPPLARPSEIRQLIEGVGR